MDALCKCNRVETPFFLNCILDTLKYNSQIYRKNIHSIIFKLIKEIYSVLTAGDSLLTDSTHSRNDSLPNFDNVTA